LNHQAFLRDWNPELLTMPNNYNTDQRKCIIKQYWKLENAEHVHTAWQEAFHTRPPSRKAIYRIRDKLETLEPRFTV